MMIGDEHELMVKVVADHHHQISGHLEYQKN